MSKRLLHVSADITVESDTKDDVTIDVIETDVRDLLAMTMPEAVMDTITYTIDVVYVEVTEA